MGELTYKMSFHNIYISKTISVRGGAVKKNNVHMWDEMELAFGTHLIPIGEIIECHL